MLPYLIVPLIIVMSSFIAYLGDHLGRRLGKRRLILFGMRPKHTAIFITVLTGTLIAIATLGSIMAIDRDVRRALLLFPEVKADLDQARSQELDAKCRLQASYQRLHNLQSQEQAARAHEKLARDQEQKAMQKLGAAENQLRSEVTALRQARARKDQLERENTGLRTLNQSLVHDRQKEQTRLASATQQLQQASVGLAEMEHQVRSYNIQVHQLRNQAAAAVSARKQAEEARLKAEHRRDEVRGQLALARSQVQVALSNLDRAQIKVKQLNAQAQTLQSQLISLSSTNKSLQGENDILKSENDTLLDRNSQLAKENREAEIALKDKRDFAAENSFAVTKGLEEWYDSTHNKIIFEPDQLIVQDIVDCSQPETEVSEDVDALLSRAAEAARTAGAGDADNPGHLFGLLDPAAPWTTHEKVREKFLQSLKMQHGKVVVRVQALRRCFASDQAVGGLYAIPFTRIFKGGDIIATTHLDGREPERNIRNEVASFLTTKVRPAALDAGMLPDAHNQVSADLLDKILDLSREVHSTNRPVEVEVLATDDTWCSEPLDLQFRVH